MNLNLTLDTANSFQRDFLLCDCGKPAAALYLQRDEEGWCVTPTCGNCLGEGFRLALADFARQPLDWLAAALNADPSLALCLLRFAAIYRKVLERIAAGGSAGISDEIRRAWGLKCDGAA